MSKASVAVRMMFCLMSLSAQSAAAETLSGKDRALFENKIRPALVKYCYECHSTDSKELGGSLRLDSRAGVLAGGQSGRTLVAGNPKDSLIIQALRYDGLEMPPDQQLPERMIRDFETWIRRGAADPRVEVKQQDDQNALDPSAVWSFLPRTVPAIPKVVDKTWPRDPIDNFVLARIESTGLTPTKDADARTLIRRLYFDLIGLPPAADDVDRFVGEYSRDPDASARHLVDRLLGSPRFGERWGRHWLDVARYGESNGDDGLGRNASFPHAWRYRDYVINALNRDVPYDRFVTEQIAGDLLDAETAAERNRQLTATGFLAIGAKPAAAMNNNFAMDVVDDQINAVCTAVMGLSVACARCHDHKHDPIPTRDYYALAGIFTSTETLYGLAANEKLTAPPTQLHALTSKLVQGETDRKTAPMFPDAYFDQINQLGPQLHVSLDVKPDQWKVESVEDFSEEHYASVKNSNLHGQLPETGDSYSVSFWFKNETPNLDRPITAYLFSRAQLGDKKLLGDHVGIGGKHETSRSGKIFVFNGNVENKKSVAGSAVIPVGTWNHVVLVRRQQHVRVFLNGVLEIDTEMKAHFGESRQYCLANRSDKFAPLVGNIAQFSIFQRALSDREAIRIHDASGQPKGRSNTWLGDGCT